MISSSFFILVDDGHEIVSNQKYTLVEQDMAIIFVSVRFVSKNCKKTFTIKLKTSSIKIISE